MTHPPERPKQNEPDTPDTPEPVPSVATEWTEEQTLARRQALAELVAYDQEIGL
jgi:hypothetical protein